MSNEEMKQQLMVQPIGVAMVATGILMAYNRGILTEEYLHCSKQ